MGEKEVRRNHAMFCCTSCEYTFAGDIPAIFVELPACPVCFRPTQIHTVLIAEGVRWER